MEMWNQKLNRENFGDFYDMYASFAYKCAYKNLRDTTRAEMCVVDAFIDTYHKRAKLDADNVIYYFSDALQLHINELASKYTVMNDSAAVEKSLDEYTASTMRRTIFEKIDSPTFRLAEFVSSTPDTKIRRKTPIIEFMQNSGVSIMLLIKLVLLAIVIAITTYFGAFTFFKADDYVVNNTERGSMKLEEYIVNILDDLPVKISGKTDVAANQSEPVQSEDDMSEESADFLDPMDVDDTPPSATRG